MTDNVLFFLLLVLVITLLACILAKMNEKAPPPVRDPRLVDTSHWSKADRDAWNKQHSIE